MPYHYKMPSPAAGRGEDPLDADARQAAAATTAANGEASAQQPTAGTT